MTYNQYFRAFPTPSEQFNSERLGHFSTSNHLVFILLILVSN